MADEIFDIVDHSDTVVGSASREEVHKSGYLHRSTHLLVFDSNNRVLLQKRSDEKDTFPGRWDSSVSGHVDSGEMYDQCVIREAFEEIGISLVEIPEKLFKIDACEETAQEFTWVYRTIHDGPFHINEREVSGVEWFALEEVDRMLEINREIFSPAFALVWATARDGGFTAS